jgi:hypothetical protein
VEKWKSGKVEEVSGKVESGKLEKYDRAACGN